MKATGPRLALGYFLAGSLWIIASDWLLARLGGDAVVAGQVGKGLAFVAAGSLLLYAFAARRDREQQVTAEHRARLERRLSALSRFEAIGQLTGGIAHDFNNLITAIAGNLAAHAGVGGRDRLPEELREVWSAADRAAELTRQLLAFGRPETARPERVEVNGVVDGMGSLLRRLIGERVRIAIELGRNVGDVRIDPGRLEQVVMNLAINARDAMPDGGELRIRTAAERVTEASGERTPLPIAPGHYVRLDVVDTGAGIPPELVGRIFEPFFTTKPNGSGTGLGLATVHAIVKQCDGHVTVDSRPGRGAVFSVYLPRATERSAPARAPAAAAAAADAEPGASHRVLVAEDDPAVRSLMVRVLERRGFDVLHAADGEEALEVLRDRSRVDLLITDASMPAMNGGQLIEAARRLAPGLRFLLVSGYADADLQATVPYMAKPFTPSQLTQRVREVLTA